MHTKPYTMTNSRGDEITFRPNDYMIIQIEGGKLHYKIIIGGHEDTAEVRTLTRPATKKIQEDLEYLHHVNGGGSPRQAGRFLGTLMSFVRGQDA